MADERARGARCEKMLADYREQLGRPFEHESRLKEVLVRQAELNAALDPDKGEQQAAAPAEGNPEPGGAVDTIRLPSRMLMSTRTTRRWCLLSEAGTI